MDKQSPYKFTRRKIIMALSQEEKQRRSEERRQKKWNETHKIIEDIDHKKCNKCDKWFPSTTDYFYKNDKNGIDGLFPYCNECAKNEAVNWVESNKDKYKKLKKKYNSKSDSKERNRNRNKRYRDSGRYYEWLEENPEKAKTYQNMRTNKDHQISEKEWLSCKEYFNNCCAYCNLHISEHFVTWKGTLKHTDLHREHVDPNGSIYLENCIPACKDCNTSKWEYKLDEWYREGNPHFTQERYNKILKWINEDYKQYFEGYDIKRNKHKKKVKNNKS
jgi:hypothetical protein